jgi:hypothetical protein
VSSVLTAACCLQLRQQEPRLPLRLLLQWQLLPSCRGPCLHHQLQACAWLVLSLHVLLLPLAWHPSPQHCWQV